MHVQPSPIENVSKGEINDVTKIQGITVPLATTILKQLQYDIGKFIQDKLPHAPQVETTKKKVCIKNLHKANS